MKTISMITLLTAISCTPKENETALNPDTGDTEETDTEETDTEETDTEETDTEETDTEETDTEETDTDNTDTDDTDNADPLANATCEMTFADCTIEEFDANDFRNETGPISIMTVEMQAYNPKCVTIKVGQTVQIDTSARHPFKKECAEDTTFDSQDLSQEPVEFTFNTPGYYNYRCAIPAHVNMVGNIRVLPN